MQMSKYVVSAQTADGRYLLYNLLSTGVTEIACSIEQILADNNEEELKVLYDEGFIVQNDEEDRQALLHFLTEAGRSLQSIRIMVLTTFDCNFECPYCFQETMHDGQRMSYETAKELVNWLSEGLKRGVGVFGMALTGGEPLLVPDVCLYLAERMGEICETRHIPTTMTMVTNGSLLRPTIASRLVKSGVKKFMVDLDGPKEHHDSLRRFKGGAPSFDTIVQNLLHLVNDLGAGLTIKIGVCKDNYHGLPDFVTQLKDLGFCRPNVSLAFGIINNNLVKDCYADVTGAEPAFLAELARSYGFTCQNMLKMPTPCLMKRGTSYTVGPNGVFYECPILVNSDIYAIGRLPDMPFPKYENKEYPLPDGCIECEYLAACMGGCLYEEAIGNKRCRRDSLASTIRQALLERFTEAASG